MGSVKEALKKYDLITVVMLCLGDPDRLEQDSILRLLSVLLSDETKKEKKKQILRDDFNIPMTETLERSLTIVCNLSEGVEARGIPRPCGRPTRRTPERLCGLHPQSDGQHELVR